MLGRIDPEKRKVNIIGGGVSGLLSSYYLARSGFEVTLYEKESRLGGMIRTSRTDFGIAESAAHSLLGTPPVLELFRELNLDYAPVSKSARARFIYRNGKPRRWPLSFSETLSSFLKAYFMLSDQSKPSRNLSLEEWGHRHLGPSFVDYFLNPFLRGIYAARPSELNIEAAFPEMIVPSGHSLISSRLALLRRRKKRKGPRTKRPGVLSPKGGMGDFLEALIRALKVQPTVSIKTGEAAPSSVLQDPNANIVLCIPADEAAKLLAKISPATASALEKISYTPLVSVTCFIETKGKASPPKGIGILFPEKENQLALGILFNSLAFPERVRAGADDRLFSCTFLFGGTSGRHWLEVSDDEILQSCAQQYSTLVRSPDFRILDHLIHRWAKAIPRYDEKQLKLQETARMDWCSLPGRVLFSNYTGKVSIRGMIETAAQAFR